LKASAAENPGSLSDHAGGASAKHQDRSWLAAAARRFLLGNRIFHASSARYWLAEQMNFGRAATIDHGPQVVRKMRAGLNLSQALAGAWGGHDGALSTTWFWRIAALRKW
jgi:hypothetical protein